MSKKETFVGGDTVYAYHGDDVCGEYDTAVAKAWGFEEAVILSVIFGIKTGVEGWIRIKVSDLASLTFMEEQDIAPALMKLVEVGAAAIAKDADHWLILLRGDCKLPRGK